MPKKKTPLPKAGTSRAEAARKRAAFINAMCDPDNKGNATLCAKIAGYSKKTAGQAGARLLQDAVIREGIAIKRRELLDQAEKITGLSLERTLREVARVAYFDPRKMFDNGRLKRIEEMDDDTAAAIASIELDEIQAGSGKDAMVIGTTKKLKVWDKNAALEKAMKHFGQYKADNEQKPPALELPAGTKSVRFDFDRIAARGKR